MDVVAIRPRRTKLWESVWTLSVREATDIRSAEEAKVMLQGVGARFDFHMCKTLCDLRSVGGS